jgi:hypothetical protein
MVVKKTDWFKLNFGEKIAAFFFNLKNQFKEKKTAYQ